MSVWCVQALEAPEDNTVASLFQYQAQRLLLLAVSGRSLESCHFTILVEPVAYRVLNARS